MSSVRQPLNTSDLAHHLQEAFRLLRMVQPPEQTLLQSTLSYAWNLAGYGANNHDLELKDTVLGNVTYHMQALQLAQERRETIEVAQQLFQAHELLAKGCLNADPQKIREATTILNYLPINNQQTKAALKTIISNLKYTGPADTSEKVVLAQMGFLVYAIKKSFTEVAVLLLKAGADPSTRLPTNKIPLLFHLVSHSNAKKSSSAFYVNYKTSYLATRELIYAFLENHFDLGTTYSECNLLEYIIPQDLHKMQYPAYTIAQALTKLFDNKKIDFSQYQVFCKKLKEKRVLHYFPTLMLRTSYTYERASYRNFYLLKYLIASLIAFCEYEISRIDSGFTALVSMSKKRNDLYDAKEGLVRFESLYFNAGYTNCWKNHEQLSEELLEKIIQLDIILSTNQIPTLSTPRTAQDWNAFCFDNEAQLQELHAKVFVTHLAIFCSDFMQDLQYNSFVRARTQLQQKQLESIQIALQKLRDFYHLPDNNHDKTKLNHSTCLLTIGQCVDELKIILHEKFSETSFRRQAWNKFCFQNQKSIQIINHAAKQLHATTNKSLMQSNPN